MEVSMTVPAVTTSVNWLWWTCVLSCYLLPITTLTSAACLAAFVRQLTLLKRWAYRHAPFSVLNLCCMLLGQLSASTSRPLITVLFFNLPKARGTDAIRYLPVNNMAETRIWPSWSHRTVSYLRIKITPQNLIIYLNFTPYWSWPVGIPQRSRLKKLSLKGYNFKGVPWCFSVFLTDRDENTPFPYWWGWNALFLTIKEKLMWGKGDRITEWRKRFQAIAHRYINLSYPWV